jgi:hypothetical protein
LKCMLLAMPTARSDVQADLVSIYYDTPDLALNRKRLTLRVGMQIANVIHSVGAILFIALILGHIYIGTIGMEGAFEATWTG